ncbi:hypothetical protein [Candidatus Williamhamiltonella defendens]|uniref:RTX toxin n=1 Tax=Candidatus Williamhamiltonella defendens TaxID=138072 RepID=A0A2D3TE81_9ENTR|nr:hypothetical protein [Candidatus Hamiltonella defensa]ATW33821.1 hypothetical protein BJP43_05545 [Candidatus Hamiltonella defensa]
MLKDSTSKPKKRLPRLKISTIEEDIQFQDMNSQNVKYVHGTNSASLSGLAHFRALLTMEQIDGTGWFHKDGLKSGERGNTIQSLGKNEPISNGVSLNYIQNYQQSIDTYSKYGETEKYYPVLYCFDSDLDLEINEKIQEHPVTKGGISIDKIKAIYVPNEFVEDAKKALFHTGQLSHVVKGFPDDKVIAVYRTARSHQMKQDISTENSGYQTDPLKNKLDETTRQKHVMVFSGFSELDYKDVDALETKITSILEDAIKTHSLDKLIVVAGATGDGIGRVYQIAKTLNIRTIGIVSEEAKKYYSNFPYCDEVFFVNDPNETWKVLDEGGKSYMVYVATKKEDIHRTGEFLVFGGGQVTVSELEEAKALGNDNIKTAIYADFEPSPERLEARRQKSPGLDLTPIMTQYGNQKNTLPSQINANRPPQHPELDQLQTRGSLNSKPHLDPHLPPSNKIDPAPLRHLLSINGLGQEADQAIASHDNASPNHNQIKQVPKSDTHPALKNTDVEHWEKPQVTTKTGGGSTNYDGRQPTIQMENDAIISKAAPDFTGKHPDSVLVQLDMESGGSTTITRPGSQGQTDTFRLQHSLARQQKTHQRQTQHVLSLKTLLDMGVNFEGRPVTAEQLNDIGPASLKKLSFGPQQLHDFLTRHDLNDPALKPALRLIKERMNAADVDTSPLLKRGVLEDHAIAKKTLNLLNEVNSHTKCHSDGTFTVKPELMRAIQTKNLVHRMNKVVNYAGLGISGLGYYFRSQVISNYEQALKQEGLTPEQSQRIEFERNFAIVSFGTNAGIDIGQYALSKMASSIMINNVSKPISHIATKARLIKVGGPVLSLLGTGFDVYDAYQAFSKLDTETAPDVRQDLIVSGSLSVAGAVVGIGTAAAFIVGGSAAAMAGPIGLVIGGVLLAGGQIYSAVRQVEEIEKQIYLSVGDKWETGWRTFWARPPSKEIQNRLANSQRGEYREMCDIFLEKNAMKMLSDKGLKNVYRYVYSLKDFNLKSQPYFKLHILSPEMVTLSTVEDVDHINNMVDCFSRVEDLEKSRNELKQELKNRYGNNWEWVYQNLEFVETSEYYHTPIFKEVDDIFDASDTDSIKNAFSLDNLDNNRADGSILFNLGDGNDQAIGYRRRRNIFLGGKGAKKYTGRALNDLFYLGGSSQDSTREDFIGSHFDGQGGEDTLVIQATPEEVDGYLVRLVDGYIYYKGRGKIPRMEKMAQITDIEHIIGHATLNDTIMGNEHDNQLNGQGGESLLYGLGGNDTLTLEQGSAYGGEGEDSYIVLQNDTGKDACIDIIDGGAKGERSHVILKHSVKQIKSITLVKKGSTEGHYSLRILLNNDNGTRTQLDLADGYRRSADGAQLELCGRYSLTTHDGVQLDTTSWPERIKVDDNNTEICPLPVLSAQYVASLDNTQKQDSNSAVIFDLSKKQSGASLPVPDARVIKMSRLIGDTSLHNRMYGDEDNNQLISPRGRSVLYGMPGNDMLALSNGLADGGLGEDSTSVLQNTDNRKAEIDIIDTGSVTAEHNHVVLQHDVTQIQSIVLIKKDAAWVNPKWEYRDNYTLRILLTNDNGTTTQVDLEDTYRLSKDGTQLQSHDRYSLTTRDGIQIDVMSWPETLKVADKQKQQGVDTWPLPLISGQYVPVYDLKRSAFLGSPAAENGVIEFIQKNPEGYSEINVGEQKTVLPKWLTLSLRDTGYNDKIEGHHNDDLLSSTLGNDLLKGGPGADIYEIDSTPYMKKTITIDNEDETDSPKTDLIVLKSVSMDQLNTLTVKDDHDLVLSAATPKMDVGILELRLRRFMQDKRYQHMVIIDKTGDSYLLEKGADGQAHIYMADFDEPTGEFKKGKQQDNFKEQASSSNDLVKLSNAAVLTENTFRALAGDDSVIDESDLDVKVYGGTDNDIVIVAKDRTGQFRKGDKTFYGEGGDDFLAGGAGSDHLYAGIGKDTLQGNAGNDRLEGGEGDDTYLYTVGDGDDVIKEIGGNNVLVLLGEITEKDVKLRKQGDHLYILIATGEGKKAGDIKIEDYFASEKHQIEKLWIANKEYHMRALLKRSATENGFHQDWPVALSDLLDHADRSLSGITQAMSAFHQPHVVNTVFGRQDMGSVFGLPLSFVELTP